MSDEAAAVIGFYERHARTFDGVRWKNLFERPWLDRFRALLPQGGSILDIGCGSGEPVARYFIEAGHDLTGVDSSSTMIGMCRSRFPEQTFVVADMRTLALGRRFAGVVAWDSFFHLNQGDQRRMFPVFRSHAASKAPLMFNSGPREGESVGTLYGDPLFHASLDPAEYRELLDAHGFDVLDYVPEDANAGGRTVWLAQAR